jgi:hypothetical protein
MQYDALTIEQGAKVDGHLALRGGENTAAKGDQEPRLVLAN